MVYKTNCSPKKISKNTVYKTSLSPKKRSTKQTFHQKKFSKKSVYKTNCSPKKHFQKNGLQNTPSTKKLKKTVYKKRHWTQMFPKKTLNTRALATKNAEDQTIWVICRGCVKWSISLLPLDKKMIFFIMMKEYPRMEIPGWQLYASWTTIS